MKRAIRSIAMPTRLRIGAFVFRVELWAPSEATAAQRLGECDLFNQVIRIRSDLPPQVKVETLLHETMHGVWLSCGLRNCNGEEEKTVTALGFGLLQLTRDNPDLFRWAHAQCEALR